MRNSRSLRTDVPIPVQPLNAATESNAGTQSSATWSSGIEAFDEPTVQFFDPQTVVTLDSSGQPKSRFADSRWDVSSMSTDGGHTRTCLYFFEASPADSSKPGLEVLIREQQKALLWLHMDAGRHRALKTIRQASHALNALARGAYRRGITLFELLCDPWSLGEETTALNSAYSKSGRALLRTLWRHREALNIGPELRVYQLIEVVKKSARAEEIEGQTPIIPSRIYCAILARLLKSLDEVEHSVGVVLEAYRAHYAAKIRRVPGASRYAGQHQRERQLKTLREAMRARGWKNGSLYEFVSGQIIRFQLKLTCVVVAFTGMRIGEASVLPLHDVIEQVDHRGTMHYIVQGYSHKLSGGRKRPASWVTSPEGHRAIMLARRIAATVQEVLKPDDPNNRSSTLLFCSTLNPYKKQSSSTNYRLMQELIPELCPLITQGDIDELNAMELERSWLREGIAVGKPWPLTFHQFRRSLSVYAHRSGMVSLPALKGQLQHITNEMRSYYSEGFCRAVNLVFDRDHFSHEWSAAKAESSFLAYSLALLFSDEDLIGEVSGRGAARMLEVVSSRSKAETLALFREGKLAYRETVLGGCTAVDGCEQSPLEPIPWECLDKNCVNSVVFAKRLSRLMTTQQGVVAALAERQAGSVEHRLEAGHLAVLMKAHQRIAEAK